MRLRRVIGGLTIAMLAAVFLSVPASAADVRSGDTLGIGPNESIDDDMYLFGRSIDMAGVVSGDVIAIGATVTISGTVEDTAIVIANSVSIPGQVGGDLFIAAQTVTISGTVGGAVRVGSTSMTLTGTASEDVVIGGALDAGASSSIGGDVLGGGDMTLRGAIEGDVGASAQRLVLHGPVGGNVNAHANRVELGPEARIGGTLQYTSANKATIAETAVVSGGITRDVPTQRVLFIRGEDSALLRLLARAWAQVQFFAGLSLAGLALLWAFPRATVAASFAVRHDWLKSIGLGLGTLFVFPVVALVVGVISLFVIGAAALPVLLFPFSLWIAIVVPSMVFPALAAGAVAVEWRRRGGEDTGTREPPRSGYALLVGAGLLSAGSFVLYLATLVPGLGTIVGGLASLATFVVVLLGIGALAITIWRSYREARSVALA